MTLTHSILLTGPSGAGKSTFARGALVAEGSGLVLASPLDELDSYYGLEAPKYQMRHFEDSTYLPSESSAELIGSPTGLRDAVRWLRLRYAEVKSDVDSGKPSRYAVLVIDTVSALGTLATNAAMHKYGRNEPPAAMSPDGAAFYTYLRQRQEELLRLARAFRGFGVHLIALSHVTESDVKDTAVAKVTDGTSRMNMPAVPGAFRHILSSFFSTVLYAGVVTGKDNTRVHYVQWKPDPKRPTKNRFGDLDTNDKIRNDWTIVKEKIEQAAAAKLSSK